MTITTPEAVPASLSRLDQLLTRAVILDANHWDEAAHQLGEAQLIAWVLAAEHFALHSVEVPGLASLDLPGCVAAALSEVQGWDLLLAAGYPDVTKLRILLSDVHRALNAAGAGGRG